LKEKFKSASPHSRQVVDVHPGSLQDMYDVLEIGEKQIRQVSIVLFNILCEHECPHVDAFVL
jgi:hypothetical protein